MISRKITLLFLFLSFTLVLSHSILPHDHQEEEHIINTAQFHAAEDHERSDHDLPDMFHNYNHAGEKEIFVRGLFFRLANQIQIKFQTSHFKSEILITDHSPPYLLQPPDNSQTNFKKILYSYSGFRAPPLS